MVAIERLTETYYVYVEYREEGDYYVAECFIHEPPFILHRVCSYKDMPTIADIVDEARRNHFKSRRPYKAGQACDGSISSPVFHLYNQLCNHFGLDPIIVHGVAYSDVELTASNLAEMIKLAEWQGVEEITNWNEATIELVLDSLTEINHHSLRNELEERLLQLSKPLH